MLKIFKEISAKTRLRKPLFLLDFLLQWELLGKKHLFFHWPLEFPSVFYRKQKGFDVVVGNPPWNEITVEELAFYALREPGLRGLLELKDMRKRIGELDKQNPELREEFELQKRKMATLRNFFTSEGGYDLQGVGDKDLYQLFCERYRHLVRENGYLGVVLPRQAFLAKGAIGFRQWLFGSNSVKRLDVLLNNKRWAFSIHAQLTIALSICQNKIPTEQSTFQLTGPSSNINEFIFAAKKNNITISKSLLNQLGNSLIVPLIPSQEHLELLTIMCRGVQFNSLKNPASHDTANISDAATSVIPHRELDETQHRRFFSHSHGVPVWKGRSFDQYDPHGRGPAGLAVWNDIVNFTQKKRLGSSKFKNMFSEKILVDSNTHPINYCRIAFRAVTNRTNSRTVISCLVPPQTPLTNTAPYLLFSNWDALAQAYVLGILNSLSFDWLTRRYVEIQLNFFILEILFFPIQINTPWKIIGKLASRLSCIDDRFTEFAVNTGVECGPLTDIERNDLKATIDAKVALAYGLTKDHLRFVFTDFSKKLVSDAYRKLVLEKFDFEKSQNSSQVLNK